MILDRLERALRAERNRARSGHWTYDLNRHIALRQAYLAERQRLELLQAERSEQLSLRRCESAQRPRFCPSPISFASAERAFA